MFLVLQCVAGSTIALLHDQLSEPETNRTSEAHPKARLRVKGPSNQKENMDEGEIMLLQSRSEIYQVSAEKLCRKSDYFKALLNSGMQESVNRKVSLPDFNEDAVKFVLAFVENDTLKEFTVDQVEEIMEVHERRRFPSIHCSQIPQINKGIAPVKLHFTLLQMMSYLQMPKLQKLVNLHLEKLVTVKNCVRLKALASQFYNTELLRIADDYLCGHAGDFVLTEDFTNLPFDEVIERELL